MPFTSATGKKERSKSCRRKSVSTEIKNQLFDVAESLIYFIDISSLNNKDKIAYLKAILPFILTKNKREDTNQMPTEFQIEIIQ